MLEECLVRVMNRIIVKTMFILIIRLYLYYLPENMIVPQSWFFLILEAAYSLAARAVACSFAREERSIIPLMVMTPCGPGILSLR